MENDKLIVLKHLLEKSILYKKIQHRFFDTEALPDYHWFKMERDNFLFVFERRLKNNKATGVTIKGLEDTIQAFKKSEAVVILSHSIEIDRDAVLIYTDEGMTRIFGIVEPNK